MGGLASTKADEWKGYCNKCVAACIATGYNGGNADEALDRAWKREGILYNQAATTAYFKPYGLQAKVSGGSAYSKSNLISALTSGQYVAIHFKGEAYGKSGQKYSRSGSMHWIGVIGYRTENGKEEIFVSDSGYSGTGWKSVDEFERCKSKMSYFTVISEK